MKKTKLSLLKGSKLKLLTVKGCHFRLYKCAKDEYSVTTRDYRILHAFESTSLSELLASEGRGKLRWIRLIERTIQHGPGAKHLDELHFQICDGRRFILDERDRLYSLQEVTLKERLFSPCGLWGLVPKAPIVHILLSSHMVDLIESIALEDQFEHVIRTFWQDWLLSQNHESDLMSPVKIQGEFGPFKAERINSKMVKFFT